MENRSSVPNGAEKEDRRLIPSQQSDAPNLQPSVGTYTFEEGLDAAGAGLYQWLLLLYVGFAWADCEWELNSLQKGAITSVVFIGMFVGAYLWGVLADTEGRKIGFLAPAVFTAVWGFASAASPNYISLLVFRGLVGLGIGGLCVAFSLFLEFVPTEQRGRFATLLQGFWTVGALFEAAVAWAVLPSLGWRYLLGISTIPFVILLVFFPFLSESPRFLAAKGKTLKAERVLAQVAKWNKRELPNGKLSAPATPAPHSAGTKDGKYHVKKVVRGMFTGFAELLSTALRKRTLLLFAIWFVHALVYYGLVLLTTELQSKKSEKCDADGSLELEKSEYLEIFIDTSAESLGFLCAFFMIDTAGRKKTMMFFLFCCGMAMWPMTLSQNEIYQTVLLFVARAAIVGSFNVLFVYTPELFPTNVRAFGLGLCSASSRFGGLIAPLFAVHLVDEGLESIVEILFAVLCFLAFFSTSQIPIETMGRKLEDTVEIEMTEGEHNTTALPSDEEIERL